MGRHDEVDPHHGNVDHPRRRDGRRGEVGMHVVGDIVDGAPGVQVGGLAHAQDLPVGQHRVKAAAGGADAAQGLVVERYPRFPARGGGAAPADLGDELAHRAAAVADDLGRPADGRRHQLEADHDEPQVLAARERFHQHPVAHPPGVLHRRRDRFGRVDAHRDAAPLLAARRLDHQRAVLGEEALDLGGILGFQLCGHRDPGLLDEPARHRLVVADRHGDGARQVGQRLAAADAAPAIGQAEEAALGIDDLDADAAAARLVDDDAGIGVERLGRRGAGEQRLVDRVLALDREERHALEAQLLVERDRLFVVVHHRQVHGGRAAGLHVLGEPPHQGLADAGLARLGIDRQAPQRRPAFGIVEGADVGHARHRADHVAGLFVFRHEVGERAAVAVGPEEIGRHRHHVVLGVDAVDRLGVLLRRQPANEEAAAPCGGWRARWRGPAGRCARGRGTGPGARPPERGAGRGYRRRCRGARAFRPAWQVGEPALPHRRRCGRTAAGPSRSR
jgi:hypothetical protein